MRACSINLFFGRYRKTTASVECRALSLKLFAAGVLVPVIKNKILFCDLAKEQDGSSPVNKDRTLIGFTFLNETG